MPGRGDWLGAITVNSNKMITRRSANFEVKRWITPFGIAITKPQRVLLVISAIGVRTANLPLAGRRVELHITVRHFPCDTLKCGSQVYAKFFADDAIVR